MKLWCNGGGEDRNEPNTFDERINEELGISSTTTTKDPSEGYNPSNK